MKIKVVKCERNETDLFLNEKMGHIFPNKHPFVVCNSDVPVIVFNKETSSRYYEGEYWLNTEDLNDFLKTINQTIMKTNKLTDLSLSDLISLYNYLNEELDQLDGCISDKAVKLQDEIREQLISTQKEIEERRNKLFNN